MLDTLDSVPWETLGHAYGPATDVPALIRQLASHDPKERESALWHLHGNIWHQGTVYEATVHTVPFFLELLQAPTVAEKAGILHLLAHLSAGHSYLDVHQDTFFYDDKRDTPEFQAEMEVELGWVRAAHEAVRAGTPTYLSLLEEPDSVTRAAAAYLLAYFSEDGLRLSRALLPHLTREYNIYVRASLLLALGVLSRGNPEHFPLLEAALEEDAPLITLAAAMSLARLRGEQMPLAAIQNLVDAVVCPSELLKQQYAQLPWADSDLVADAGTFLVQLGPQRAAPALRALLAALDQVDAYSAIRITELLLYVAFSHNPAPPTAQGLSDIQRTVLRTIVASDNAWTFNGNLSSVLHSFNLPTWREPLQRYLDEVE